jgi:hypothetical protein
LPCLDPADEDTSDFTSGHCHDLPLPEAFVLTAL